MRDCLAVLCRRAACLLLIAVCASALGSTARAQTNTASQPNAKIRAITAFVSLDRARYQQQIAEALKMLKYARTVYESRGFSVQTIRIATQPFPEYTQGMSSAQALAFFQQIDSLAQEGGFIVSIGPAMLNPGDPVAQADLLAEILSKTKALNGSVVVAGDDGVRWNAVGAAARVIKSLESSTERGEGNFRFAAIAEVPPLTPFFPAAYHTGFGHQFAVGLESAGVVLSAFRGAPNLSAARQRLNDQLTSIAFEVERHANRIDRDTGWTYMGIDLSPAPSKDASIGAAMEELAHESFGGSGTLTAAAIITAAVKDISVRQTGYSGLMLPVLEDPVLARRWSEGGVSLDGLLAYSSVCGTGLDTVPLPGSVSEEQLDLIIGDVASLAVKWHKPLSARLMPAPGKQPGDITDFAGAAIINATIQPMEQKPAQR